jgi:hypothetical protein
MDVDSFRRVHIRVWRIVERTCTAIGCINHNNVFTREMIRTILNREWDTYLEYIARHDCPYGLDFIMASTVCPPFEVIQSILYSKHVPIPGFHTFYRVIEEYMQFGLRSKRYYSLEELVVGFVISGCDLTCPTRNIYEMALIHHASTRDCEVFEKYNIPVNHKFKSLLKNGTIRYSDC